MFSKLDGIFPGLPLRHVESANARLEIRRDESRDQGKKKQGHEDGEYSPIPWEDISYVSIGSLLAFLESLIITEDQITPALPHMHEASNTRNQRATSAYQSVGRAVHDENVYAPTPEPSAHIETNFTTDDLARVRIFVAELKELQRNNINELGMQRSATFLDSLAGAIEVAKTAV